MPTGYTAQILDGSVKTFPEFAKLCLRAMMVSVHMRDEPLSKPFKPREPSTYYKEQYKKAKQELIILSVTTDDQLTIEEKLRLEKDIDRYKLNIFKAKKNKAILDDMLDQVESWKIPTEEYANFKKFMIDQLESTIKQDGYALYSAKAIEEAKNNLKNINPKKIRKERQAFIHREIEFFKEKHDKEVENCNYANKFVEVLMQSIEPQTEKTK